MTTLELFHEIIITGKGNLSDSRKLSNSIFLHSDTFKYIQCVQYIQIYSIRPILSDTFNTRILVGQKIVYLLYL